jgi:hypothetical protein
MPRNHDAQFPDRCVQCDLSNNGNTMQVRAHSIGSLTALLMVFGKQFSGHVPVCQPCATQIRNRKSFSIMGNITVAGLVMIPVWPQVVNFAPESLR